MAEKTRFGALLKHYRQAAGLTQEALAERAGLSPRAVSDLERGINRAPRSGTLELLARGLSLNPQQHDFLKSAAQAGAGLSTGTQGYPSQPGLPVAPTRLIGRETERTQALDLILEGNIRLLTLTGPSGVGKTRLALQVAQDLAPDFPDGVVYAPLASILDASLVAAAVAQILGIHETPPASTQDQVAAFLKAKHLLLVMDNLEQVLDCSPFVAYLLSHCPRLVILATSRAPLRLRAEQEQLLAPLPLEAAVALFCERVQVVQPSQKFPLEDVASICEQLDRIPLAIELAAMNGRLLSIPELRARLAHRFALLRGGARDLPARQQTMEDAIAWSYDLLTEPQQRCFRALGIFVGGWTLEAAEEICWAGGEAEPEEQFLILTALVEASLVQTERDSRGAVRFSMLELIREFASKRLHAAGEAELTRARHAAYYTRLADRAEALFKSGPNSPNLSLAKEFPNVLAGMQWVEESHAAEIGLKLAGFARLWMVLGQPSQAGRCLERMLAVDLWARTHGQPGAPLPLRIEKLYGLGRILLSLGQMERAKTVTREALDLAQQSGDENGVTNAWMNLGLIAQGSGNLDEAEKAFQQSAQHADRAGDSPLHYRAMVNLAELARGRGDLNRAASLLETALAISQDFQIGWDTAIIITLLGHLARQQQNFPLAKARYRESLLRLRVFESPTYIAWCLEGCAAVLCMDSRATPAARLCGAAANLRQRAGTPLPPNEREGVEQIVDKIRTLLGPEIFQEEWTAGAHLTQDQAIEIALSELE